MPRKRILNEEQESFYKKNCKSKSKSEWMSYFGCREHSIVSMNIRFGLNSDRPISEETKAKISAKRKEWLATNPERHPWRNKDKFKSEPCEKVKEFLLKLGVQFISEYQPNLDGRHFSIDIAIPDKLIALEINGNQHYEKKGTLKPYYQERHDLLEKNGWTVYEIHYSSCFNLDKWADFVREITQSETKVQFDYFSYKPVVKKENPPVKIKEHKVKLVKPPRVKRPLKYCSCGKLICRVSTRCRKCARPLIPSKYNYPTPEEMRKLVWEVPASILKKTLGMSDVSIGKFCKKYGIKKPSRGYWQKKRFGTL